MNNLCYLENPKFYPPKEKPKNLAYKKPYLKDRRGEEKTEKFLEIRSKRQEKNPEVLMIESLLCQIIGEKIEYFSSGKMSVDKPKEARAVSNHIHHCETCFTKFWEQVEKMQKKDNGMV